MKATAFSLQENCSNSLQSSVCMCVQSAIIVSCRSSESKEWICDGN